MDIYHYTYGHKLQAIAATRELRPTGETIPEHEKKSLWYSTQQVFEQTALKPVRMHGSSKPVRLAMHELHELVGVYRFATTVAGVGAKQWPDAVREIGILPADVAHMERMGRELGANPMDWWATVEAKPLTLHQFERWTGAKWESAILHMEIAHRQGAKVVGAATGDRWTNMTARA